MRIILLSFCLILLLHIEGSKAIAQNKAIDSLLTVLKNTEVDTMKVKLLVKLSFESLGSDPQKMKEYAEEALAISTSKSFSRGEAEAFKNLGIYYYLTGNHPKSIESFYSSLKKYEELENELGQASILGNMCIVYQAQANYPKALDGYFRALRIFEKHNSLSSIANCFNNIGLIYQDQKNEDLALEYFERSLKIEEELNNEGGIAGSYSNIGYIHLLKKDFPKALDYFEKSQKIYINDGDNLGLAGVYINIGQSFLAMKKGKLALGYFEKARAISEDMDLAYYLINSYEGIAKSYREMGNLTKTIEYYKIGLAKSGDSDLDKEKLNIYNGLAEVFSIIGKYKEAYEYQIKYQELNDFLFNEENTKKIAQTLSIYETETKQAQIDLLLKDKTIQEQEIKRQTIIRDFFSAISGFVAVLAFVLYTNNRRKHKLNKILTQQKEEIEKKNIKLKLTAAQISQQKEEIEAQRDNIEMQNNDLEMMNMAIAQAHKDITGSINYAKRIQTAMLPAINNLQKLVPESFILFRPRDIVSGDFYWFNKIDDKTIIAAVDCTGHGVPGAFMSILGNDLLNEIVSNKGITEPHIILHELNKGIQKVLHQGQTESTDGMDISICVIDAANETVDCAAAMSSMYLVQEGKLIIVPPNKVSIGGFVSTETKAFQKHTYPINNITSIYLATDGYQDQFGGPNNKKFMAKKLKSLLLEIHSKPVEAQKEVLENTLVNWQGNEAQVDDILVIGLILG
jgi:serine phosphatase RsbU (regulator of sigma subunit)